MISRRNSIKSVLAGGAALSLIGRVHASTEEVEPYSDPSAADRFVQAWMSKEKSQSSPSTNDSSATVMKNADGSFIVGRFADRMYYTAALMGWNPSNSYQKKNYKSVVVPIGFVTDFASIPRALWSLLPPDGPYVYAAVVHDYLYWEQFISREAADDILKFLMQDFKLDAITLGAIYGGVRVGGWAAWNENAKRKAAGEKRILRTPPKDPTLRWAAIRENNAYFK